MAVIRLAAKKPRRKPRENEDRELRMFMRWLHTMHPGVFVYVFHPPNGGKRDKATAGKLKAMGVKPGVPDVFCMLPRGGYHGLVVEYKATPPNDAEVSPYQKEWITRLSQQGYKASVCKGLAAIKDEFTNYLKLPVQETISA
ncbi:VRR-NUC domain-containing protein [Endozoicomonas sp. Mp262]|uniref:VRR-NUC domain-containing protein n=1 Tax=Endozoicomonas sp. Mp262 TaxID=2919499 RepID=UPI0021DB43A2